MRRVPITYLLAQGKVKREVISPAGELYISPWFLKARGWVLARVEGSQQQRSSGIKDSGRHTSWAILTARHGLVTPQQKIAPDNDTLTGIVHPTIRRAWARAVARQITRTFPAPRIFVFLAGRRFREFLIPMLEGPAYACLEPLAGLGIGQQMKWLETHMDENPMEMELDLEKLDAELAELSPQALHEAMLAIVHESRQSTGQSPAQTKADRELLAEANAALEELEIQRLMEKL